MNPQLEALLRAHPAGTPMTDEIVTLLGDELVGSGPPHPMDAAIKQVVRVVVELVENLHEIGKEPTVDGWPLYSGLPPPNDAVRAVRAERARLLEVVQRHRCRGHELRLPDGSRFAEFNIAMLDAFKP